MFNTVHILSPEEVRILIAAAAGSFVTLLVDRAGGWLRCSSLFAAGQLMAYYWTIPVVMYFMWSGGWDQPIGFFFGACGLGLWGAVVGLTGRLSDDPLGTIGRARRIWKGDTDEK